MAASIGFDVYAKDRASRTFNDVGRSADRTSDKMRKLGRGVKLAGAAVAVGLGMAAVGAYKLAKGASEDQAAAVKLSVALRNNADATKGQIAATEDWITAQGKALGVTDDELRPALGQLVTATHDVGKAQRLASLAMNVSAGTGKSLGAVSMALMKAQNGQVSSLARLGINVKNAKGETVSFREATRRMADTFRGQAAKAADTTAGRFARLKLILDETGESIGYKLLPPATRLAGWMLNVGIPAAGRFADWWNAKVAPALRRVGRVIQNDVMPVAVRFGNWIQNKAAPAVAAFAGQQLASLRKAFRDVSRSVDKNRPALQQFGAKLKQAGDFAGKYLLPALHKLQSKQLAGLVIALKLGIRYLSFANAQMNRMAAVAGAVSGAVKRMAGVVSGAAGSFQRLASAAGQKMNALVGRVRALPGQIRAALGSAGSMLYTVGTQIIQGLINGMRAKVGELLGLAGSIAGSIKSKIAGALDIRSPSRVMMKIGGYVMDGLTKGIEGKRGGLAKLLDRVTDLVKAKGQKLKDLMGKRSDFAAGFQMGDSIFATPDTEVTTKDSQGNELTSTVGPTLASMKAFALTQKTQAAQVNADVKRLTSLGLSKSLITQMQSQGAAGIAQMHALAGASKSDIASFNALDKDTRNLYGGAGMAAGNAMYGDQIADAKKDERLAKAVAKAVRQAMDGYTHKQLEHLEFTIKGNTLVAVLKKEKKDQGGKKLGLD